MDRTAVAVAGILFGAGLVVFAILWIARQRQWSWTRSLVALLIFAAIGIGAIEVYRAYREAPVEQAR